MQKNCFLIILLFAFRFNSDAQLRFYKTYSNFQMGTKSYLTSTADGGWTTTANYNGINMTRFDKCGMLQWCKHYASSMSVVFTDVISRRTGGFALTGYYGVSYPYNCDPFLLLLDNNGNITDFKIYQASSYEHIYSIGEDLQGNFFIDGNTDNGNGTDLGNNFILKTDSLGNILWCKLYATGGYWGLGTVCHDGGLLRCHGLGQLYKIDANGNVIWAKQGYPGARYKFVEMNDGYAYIPYGTYNGFVAKLDLNGNVVWKSKDYQLLRGNGLKSIIQLAGNHVAVSSSASSMIMEFNETGRNVAHNNLRNPSTMLNPSITHLAMLKDSTIAVTGIDGQMFIAKLNTSLMSGCADNIIAADTAATYPWTITSTGYTVVNKNFTILNSSLTATDFNPQEQTICEIRDSLNFTVTDPLPICSGTSITLRINPSSETSVNWIWFEGSCEGAVAGIGESVIQSPLQTSTLYVRGEAACDTTPCQALTIIVNPAPEASFDAKYSLNCEGATLAFVNKSHDASNYFWNFGDGTSSVKAEPVHTYSGQQSVTTTLIASNAYCSDTTFINTNFNSIFETIVALVPNVFTPNNDEINDQFSIVLDEGLTECVSIQIFDRWGIEMFRSEQTNMKWDGRTTSGQKAVAGTYFYILKIRDIQLKGQISLLD